MHHLWLYHCQSIGTTMYVLVSSLSPLGCGRFGSIGPRGDLSRWRVSSPYGIQGHHSLGLLCAAISPAALIGVTFLSGVSK